MEFGLREVLILVGLVVIAGIAFDGYRRMRKSRNGELKLPSEMGGSCEDEWEYFRGELPNGGARRVSIKGRRQAAETETSHELSDEDFGSAIDDAEMAFEESSFDDAAVSSSANSGAAKTSERRPQRTNTIPGQKVTDDAEYQQAYQAHQQAYEAEEYETEPYPAEQYRAEEYQPEPYPTAEYERKPAALHEVEHDQSDLFTDDDLLVASRAEQQSQLQRKTSTSRRRDTAPADVEIDPSLQEVFVINVMARQGELDGADLLRVMLSCGFRFGDMNIFHRYEQHSGKGGLLFSAANVVEPGVFDLEKMEQFSTPGICIFMKLPGPKRPLHSFEIMMDSARKIAKLLDADIKDENHNILRQQTAEHYRQRVLDFERKMLSYRASHKQF